MNGDVLDDARAALLSVTLDVQRAVGLIDKLKVCADAARDSGDSAIEHSFRQIVAELERRLMEG